MEALDTETLELIFAAMKNSLGDYTFLVEPDNRKQLEHATFQLEEHARAELDNEELSDQFADLRQSLLDLCPSEEPHTWKILDPVWSERKGYYVYPALCTKCRKKTTRDEIPLWNPAVNYEGEDDDS